jgi:predicted choloylglycine hydrolase
MKKSMFSVFVLMVGLWLMVFQVPGVSYTASTSPPVNVTGTPQVVVVSGSNYEMGVQYGEQAAALIYANKQIVNQRLVEQFGAQTVENDIKVWTYYLEKYDPELKDWLRGISIGCLRKRFRVSYADLVANMVLPQELWARPEGPYPPETRVKAASTSVISQAVASAENSKPYCQSFGATKTATKDNKPLVSIAAGMDFEVINHVILMAFPTDGYPFIAFPVAGRIANNQGMNSKYAWVMPAAPAIESIWGVTSEVYFHYLLQYAASPAEAQQYLDSTPRGGVTGNFIFADPTGNLYAYEANGQKAAARKPGDLGEKDFVIMGNDFVGPSMKDQNWPDVWAASYNKTMRDRYETVFEWLLPAAERSMIDVDFVKAVWNTPDWYDSVTKEWHYNDPLSDSVPVNAGGPMHQHIYFPADKIAYIQFGNPLGVGANWPANSTGEYTKWQLKNSPAEVASAAENDAFSMYTAASGLFNKMSNAGDLDYNTSQSLKAKLNEAMLAWSDGIDREAFAYYAASNGGTERVQMALWSDALTNYAKTQLYAQMVTTALNALANPVNSASLSYADTGTPQVVVVSGTNYEMGVQYGLQTAPAIAHNLALMKSALYKAFGSAATTNDMKVWNYYMKQYDPTLQNWLLGILKGCRQKGYYMSYLDLVLLMVFPSEMWARPTDPYPPITGVQAEGMSSDTVGESAEDIHSCNAFAATGKATKDGKPIIAIDQMVSSLAMNTVILVAFPTDGASFVSVPYAGRVNGNSAMNSYGLAWTLTALFPAKPLWGLVTEVYFHYLAQVTKTPAEAQEYLKSTPRAGVTGGVTTSDAAGNLSVFESNSPTKFVIRKPGDEGETGPFVVMTNHLVDPSTQTYARSSSFFRYATTFKYVSDAAATSSIDFSFAKNMFMSDDWYDPDAKQWHYNDPASGYIANALGSTVNTSIYFPASLTAYFGVGTPSGIGMPAYATGEYVKIQLGKDPSAVTTAAGSGAYAFYKDARNFFEHDLNAKAPYLTTLLAQTAEDKLDEAMSAYSLGMDRAAFAYLEKDVNKQLALYSEALTYYAKAQLYSQMVKTMLLRASGQ